MKIDTTNAIKKENKTVLSTVIKPKETENVEIKQEVAKNEIQEEGDAVKQMKWEPRNWELILSNLRKMRAAAPAPVDTMGCHKCYDEKADEKVSFISFWFSLDLFFVPFYEN